MCSIIGFKGNYKKELIEKILDESQIRGIHAFGFSYYENGVLKTNKFLDYSEFKKSIHSVEPDLFIAHFRYSTSGDYNIIENNQPINFENKSIAFNGIISQKDKAEIEKEYGVEMNIENDGYVLIQKYSDEIFVKSDNITFSMVGLDNGNLIALKNKKRPLYLNDETDIIVCSTKDIMKRSGIETQKELKNLKLYVW